MRKYEVVADIDNITELVYVAKDIDHAEVAVDIFSECVLKAYNADDAKVSIRINVVEVQ